MNSMVKIFTIILISVKISKNTKGKNSGRVSSPRFSFLCLSFIHINWRGTLKRDWRTQENPILQTLFLIPFNQICLCTSKFHIYVLWSRKVQISLEQRFNPKFPVKVCGFGTKYWAKIYTSLAFWSNFVTKNETEHQNIRTCGHQNIRTSEYRNIRT